MKMRVRRRRRVKTNVITQNYILEDSNRPPTVAVGDANRFLIEFPLFKTWELKLRDRKQVTNMKEIRKHRSTRG